jgi:hypothetical protein
MSKKESALDLAKFVDKGIRVKLAGGREGELYVCSIVHTAERWSKALNFHRVLQLPLMCCGLNGCLGYWLLIL